MVPLTQLVGSLEFNRVVDKISRGSQLPEGCMVKRRWWEPWSRDLVEEMAMEMPLVF